MINKIEGNLLLQESSVRLDFKDASLEHIVKSISKQVGFESGSVEWGPALGGTSATGASRSVEPGPVPFWKAIDRLCEVGKLTWNYRVSRSACPGVPQPALVLSYNPDSAWPSPVLDHGPFHFSVISLSYQNTIYFQSSAPMFAPPTRAPQGWCAAKKKGSLPELKQRAAAMLPGVGEVAKKKGSRPTIKPSPPGAGQAR